MKTTHRGFTITDNKHYFTAIQINGKIRYDALTHKEVIKKIDFHLDGISEIETYEGFLISKRILPEKTYFFASNKKINKIPTFFSAKSIDLLKEQITNFNKKQNESKN